MSDSVCRWENVYAWNASEKFSAGGERENEDGRVRGMKMIPAWRTSDGDVGDAAFFLNEFRPVYFAYSIPPTKTRLSVFSRSALGRCGGRDILALKHIPSAGGCLRRLSRPCLRKFAIHPEIRLSDSITNESVVIFDTDILILSFSTGSCERYYVSKI